MNTMNHLLVMWDCIVTLRCNVFPRHLGVNCLSATCYFRMHSVKFTRAMDNQLQILKAKFTQNFKLSHYLHSTHADGCQGKVSQSQKKKKKTEVDGDLFQNVNKNYKKMKHKWCTYSLPGILQVSKAQRFKIDLKILYLHTRGGSGAHAPASDGGVRQCIQLSDHSEDYSFK